MATIQSSQQHFVMSRLQLPYTVPTLVEHDTPALIIFDCRGHMLLAVREALQSMQGTLLGAMFSGRWRDTRNSSDTIRIVTVDYDADAFSIILHFIHLKWLSMTPMSKLEKATLHELLETMWIMEKKSTTEFALKETSFYITLQSHINKLLTEDLLDEEIEAKLGIIKRARPPIFELESPLEDLIDYLGVWEYMYDGNVPFSFINTGLGMCVHNHGRTVKRVLQTKEGYAIATPSMSETKNKWRMCISQLNADHLLFIGVMAASTYQSDNITRMEGSYGWVSRYTRLSLEDIDEYIKDKAIIEGPRKLYTPLLRQGDEMLMCLNKQKGVLSLKIFQHLRPSTPWQRSQNGTKLAPTIGEDLFHISVPKSDDYYIHVILYGEGDMVDMVPLEDDDYMFF